MRLVIKDDKNYKNSVANLTTTNYRAFQQLRSLRNTLYNEDFVEFTHVIRYRSRVYLFITYALLPELPAVGIFWFRLD